LVGSDEVRLSFTFLLLARILIASRDPRIISSRTDYLEMSARTAVNTTFENAYKATSPWQN
jgi:hypothetical protein